MNVKMIGSALIAGLCMMTVSEGMAQSGAPVFAMTNVTGSMSGEISSLQGITIDHFEKRGRRIYAIVDLNSYATQIMDYDTFLQHGGSLTVSPGYTISNYSSGSSSSSSSYSSSSSSESSESGVGLRSRPWVTLGNGVDGDGHWLILGNRSNSSNPWVDLGNGVNDDGEWMEMGDGVNDTRPLMSVGNGVNNDGEWFALGKLNDDGTPGYVLGVRSVASESEIAVPVLFAGASCDEVQLQLDMSAIDSRVLRANSYHGAMADRGAMENPEVVTISLTPEFIASMSYPYSSSTAMLGSSPLSSGTTTVGYSSSTGAELAMSGDSETLCTLSGLVNGRGSTIAIVDHLNGLIGTTTPRYSR